MLHSGIHTSFMLSVLTGGTARCGARPPHGGRGWSQGSAAVVRELGEVGRIGKRWKRLEATPGIEPGYTVLQTVA